MAGWVVVRFPPTPVDFPGAPQGHHGPLQGAADSPSLAEEALVSHTPPSGPQSTLGPTGQGGPPLTGRGPDLASQSCPSAALSMAPPQSRSQRLDEAVLRTMGHARALSTCVNYNQKWRVFLTWCRHAQVDPSMCAIELVHRFLQSLLDSGRAASTIKVYTAAMSFFHEAVGGVAVGRHPLVSQFIKEACHLRLTRSPRAPSWDLL